MRKQGLRERVIMRHIDRHGRMTLASQGGLIDAILHSAAEKLRKEGLLAIDAVDGWRVTYVRSRKA